MGSCGSDMRLPVKVISWGTPRVRAMALSSTVQERKRGQQTSCVPQGLLWEPGGQPAGLQSGEPHPDRQPLSRGLPASRVPADVSGTFLAASCSCPPRGRHFPVPSCSSSGGLTVERPRWANLAEQRFFSSFRKRVKARPQAPHQ